MSTKRMVELDPEVYERVQAEKRDDETVSEAIERLIGGQGVSLLDLVDGEGHTPEREAEMLERLETTAQADEAALDDLDSQRDT